MIIITQVLRVMLAALLFRIRVSIIDVAIEVDHRKTLRPLAFLILMSHEFQDKLFLTFLGDKLFTDPLLLVLKLMVQRMGGTTTVDFEVLELSQPFQMVERLKSKVKVGSHHVFRGLGSKVWILPDPSVLPRQEMTTWAALAGGCISQFLEDFTITI